MFCLHLFPYACYRYQFVVYMVYRNASIYSLTQCEAVFRPLYLAGQIRNFATQQGFGALQHLEVMWRSSEALLVGTAGPNEGRHEHGHDDNCWTGKRERERWRNEQKVSLSMSVRVSIRIAAVWRTTCGVRN